jgi:hypothetical protein
MEASAPGRPIHTVYSCQTQGNPTGTRLSIAESVSTDPFLTSGADLLHSSTCRGRRIPSADLADHIDHELFEQDHLRTVSVHGGVPEPVGSRQDSRALPPRSELTIRLQSVCTSQISFQYPTPSQCRARMAKTQQDRDSKLAEAPSRAVGRRCGNRCSIVHRPPRAALSGKVMRTALSCVRESHFLS